VVNKLGRAPPFKKKKEYDSAEVELTLVMPFNKQLFVGLVKFFTTKYALL
jgi:hypothetical protein